VVPVDEQSPSECDGQDVVTGAFSYTGRYIAQKLLARGRRVVTLTNHPAKTNLSDWLASNAAILGQSYFNELDMHFR
jgi:NAD(P)-dependent dehydrogenase (short-subunit alcohol dehydrogenase family)